MHKFLDKNYDHVRQEVLDLFINSRTKVRANPSPWGHLDCHGWVGGLWVWRTTSCRGPAELSFEHMIATMDGVTQVVVTCAVMGFTPGKSVGTAC